MPKSLCGVSLPARVSQGCEAAQAPQTGFVWLPEITLWGVVASTGVFDVKWQRKVFVRLPKAQSHGSQGAFVVETVGQ